MWRNLKTAISVSSFDDIYPRATPKVFKQYRYQSHDKFPHLLKYLCNISFNETASKKKLMCDTVQYLNQSLQVKSTKPGEKVTYFKQFWIYVMNKKKNLASFRYHTLNTCIFSHLNWKHRYLQSTRVIEHWKYCNRPSSVRKHGALYCL